MNIVLWMIACYSAGNDTNRLALEDRRPDGYAAHGGRVLRADARDNRHLVVRLYESREDAEDAARAYKRRPPKPSALRGATLGSGGLRVGLIPEHGAGFGSPPFAFTGDDDMKFTLIIWIRSTLKWTSWRALQERVRSLRCRQWDARRQAR